MKKVVIAVVGFLMAVSFVSCKKDDVASPASAALTASKTSSIKTGEPVVFTMSQVAAGSAVTWSVSTAGNSQSANALVSSSGNQASIRFAQKGNYTVTSVFGATTASSSVSVSDTAYSGSGTTPSTVAFSAGELINITVSRIDSGATSGLLFSALTTNSYSNIGNSLVSTFSSGTNSYVIGYTGVSVPAASSQTAKAGGFNYLYPVSAGANTLTINFNGTPYTGTINKTGNSYTISWAYTTGVTISPKSL